MGMLVCVVLGLGVAPHRHVSRLASSPCRISRTATPPPVALPCERIVYQGGMLNAAFTALCGLMLIGVAAWLLWELWSAVEPKPITDDFLRLLNDSFGRDWRNPLKWPWARAAVGVRLHAGRRDADGGRRRDDLDARRLVAAGQGADRPNRHVTELQTRAVNRESGRTIRIPR